jgi:hypothetical protein
MPVLYGHETCCFALREEYGSKVLQDKIVTKIAGKGGRSKSKCGENYTARSFMTDTVLVQ